MRSPNHFPTTQSDAMNGKCPICNESLRYRNLLDDDAIEGVVLSQARLEEGLNQHGMRCEGDPSHWFAFMGAHRVQVEYVLGSQMVTRPNLSTSQKMARWLASAAFRTGLLPVLPAFVSERIADRLYVCRKADSWRVATPVDDGGLDIINPFYGVEARQRATALRQAAPRIHDLGQLDDLETPPPKK